MIEILQKPLGSKKGVVLGIANEHSIAYGCAQAFRAFGADLAITYGHDKSKPHVEPLARELEAPIFLPVTCSSQVSMRRCLRAYTKAGEGSILRFTQSLLHRKRICTAASPTAHATDSSSQWTSLAILSYAWRGWRSR